MTDNEAAAVSPELIEAAKQLLADTMGWPVKSDTEMDLSDRDQVFTDVAVLAVAKALNSTRSPVPHDGEVERLRAILVEQTNIVDRLCSAIERAEHDIGGESVSAVLALLGPANDRALAILTALRASTKPTQEPG